MLNRITDSIANLKFPLETTVPKGSSSEISDFSATNKREDNESNIGESTQYIRDDALSKNNKIVGPKIKKYIGPHLEFHYIDKFLTSENATSLLQYMDNNIKWPRTLKGKIYTKRLSDIYGVDENSSYGIPRKSRNNNSDEEDDNKNSKSTTYSRKIKQFNELPVLEDLFKRIPSEDAIQYCVVQR